MPETNYKLIRQQEKLILATAELISYLYHMELPKDVQERVSFLKMQIDLYYSRGISDE